MDNSFTIDEVNTILAKLSDLGSKMVMHWEKNEQNPNRHDRLKAIECRRKFKSLLSSIDDLKSEQPRLI